jgi:hypothetical protein
MQSTYKTVALAAPAGAWLMTKLIIFVFCPGLFEYMLEGSKVTSVASIVTQDPGFEKLRG